MSNPQLRQALLPVFERLRVAYAGSPALRNEKLIDVWVEVLNGVALDAIPEATRRVLRSAKHLPRPAEFLEACRDVMRERRLDVASHGPERVEVACLTCGTPTPQWTEAIPVGSQTGTPRIVCRCAIAKGHALHRVEWERLRDAQGLPVPPVSAPPMPPQWVLFLRQMEAA